VRKVLRWVPVGSRKRCPDLRVRRSHPVVITDDMLHPVLRRKAAGKTVKQIRPDLIIPAGKRKGPQPQPGQHLPGPSPSTTRPTPRPSKRSTPTSPPWPARAALPELRPGDSRPRRQGPLTPHGCVYPWHARGPGSCRGRTCQGSATFDQNSGIIPLPVRLGQPREQQQVGQHDPSQVRGISVGFFVRATGTPDGQGAADRHPRELTGDAQAVGRRPGAVLIRASVRAVRGCRPGNRRRPGDRSRRPVPSAAGHPGLVKTLAEVAGMMRSGCFGSTRCSAD
jgi:hypothetical protein